MRILAFDTSTEFLSAALFEGSKKIASVQIKGRAQHSDVLAPTLEALMKRSKVFGKPMDCVAVGLGPGSFTGLRVAVTTTKLLAYAWRAKIVGISSLEAAARTVSQDGLYAVMKDCKKNQVYGAVYERLGKKWSTVQEPAIWMRSDFVAFFQKKKAQEILKPPCAKAIALAAFERIQEKRWDDVFALEPIYLHPKDCNVSIKK